MSRRTTPERRSVGVHFDGDLRRALMDAAVETLDSVGADNLSLRDVARRIGVSHAAPAHHFGDKAGLLTAVATEGFGLFVEHLACALIAAPTEPVAQLSSLGRAYVEFAELHPGTFEVMFRPALTHTGDAAFAAASDAAFEVLRLHIERCQRAGWRADAESRALAAAAWALAHGISVLRSQGSLARHFPDASLDGVEAIAATLIATGEAAGPD